MLLKAGEQGIEAVVAVGIERPGERRQCSHLCRRS